MARPKRSKVMALSEVMARSFHLVLSSEVARSQRLVLSFGLARSLSLVLSMRVARSCSLGTLFMHGSPCELNLMHMSHVRDRIRQRGSGAKFLFEHLFVQMCKKQLHSIAPCPRMDVSRT